MNIFSSFSQISIRIKVLFLLMFTFGIMILMMIFVLTYAASDTADIEIERTLTQTRSTLLTRLHSRFESIKQTSKTIARSTRIQPLLEGADLPSLLDQSEELQQEHGFDILIITDSNGKILSRSDNRSSAGKSVSHSELFLSALQGTPAHGYMRSDEQIYQIVATPILDKMASDVVRGTIAVAYQISNSLAVEIKNLSQSELSLFKASLKDKELSLSLVSSSLPQIPDAFHEKLTQALKENFSESIFSDNRLEGPIVDDDHFESVILILRAFNTTPVGVVTLSRSRTQLLLPFYSIVKHIVIVCGTCFIFVVIFSMIFARGVQETIRNIVATTQAIRDGQAPELHAKYTRGEIGALYRAVVEMGRGLKEKADIEDYLSALSGDLAPIADSNSIRLRDNTHALDDTHIQPLIADPDALPINTTIGDRYTIEQFLGKGGVGYVYRAYDTALKETIALKTISRDFISRFGVEMLRQEIKLARQISHRHIVRTHDIGTTADMAYITMEFVSGHTLREFIESRGPIPLTIGLILSQQICSAVAAAHRAGVIHRDLKPSNMIISSRGVLKIMDFGIALTTSAEDASDALDQDTSGKIGDNIRVLETIKRNMGTPQFMAPEQFRGRSVTLHSDIFSVGLILFYMFAGRHPCTSEDSHVIENFMCHGEMPQLIDIRPEIPADLNRIIDTSLKKNPDDRYQSASELLLALQSVHKSLERTHEEGRRPQW